MEAIWTLTLTGSLMALLVLLLRALLGRRLPPRLSYALWLPVLLCLLVPLRLPSAVSIRNAAPVQRVDRAVAQIASRPLALADGEAAQPQATAAPAEDDYFATARLSRKQARDNAISMLKEAERDENAQQSVLNEASQTLQVLAAYTVAESQIESLVTAKGYADCVVFMGAESVSVVVAPPEGGLTATDAARIKDIVISETDYTAQQIKIMEAN